MSLMTIPHPLFVRFFALVSIVTPHTRDGRTISMLKRVPLDRRVDFSRPAFLEEQYP